MFLRKLVLKFSNHTFCEGFTIFTKIFAQPKQSRKKVVSFTGIGFKSFLLFIFHFSLLIFLAACGGGGGGGGGSNNNSITSSPSQEEQKQEI